MRFLSIFMLFCSYAFMHKFLNAVPVESLIFSEEVGMSQDFVRTSIVIDRRIWARFKAQCTLENKTAADLIEELIGKYLQSKRG
jgi:hypothetical protein